MKERQYEVEVYEKYSHGCWGKRHYFGWILSSDKKENAESFALDIIAGMSPNELVKEADGKMVPPGVCGWHTWEDLGNGKRRWVKLDNDKPVGYEFAEGNFTVKARLFKG